MAERLTRLLRPRSIAVIGGREAAEAARQCRRIGFEGEIWPVHPRHRTVQGLACFRSVADLPGVPDAAFVGVNRELSVRVVAELAHLGAGGAVCYAAGFQEAVAEDAGARALQRDLVDAAGAMPLIGPNCFGFLNYLDGAALWPDQHGGRRVTRGVALIAQSSNLAINLTMQRRGLPVGYVLTLGNQAAVGLADLIRGALGDDRVTAIGLYAEGLGDIGDLARALGQAQAQGVPVVALKAGRTPEAAAAVLSHSASLAGADRLADAFFARHGVARVESLGGFLDALNLLDVHGPLTGPELCALSCSGGEAALIADAARGRRVRFRPLRGAERAAVKATLGDLVAVANPLDYHTFIWGDEARLTRAFGAMLGLGFDLGLLVLDFPRDDRCDAATWQPTLAAIKTAARVSGTPTGVVATLPENLPEAVALELRDAGIAPLFGLESALEAAASAWTVGAARDRPAARPMADPGGPPGGDRVLLDEAAAKAELAAFGLAIPSGRVADGAADAAAAAAEIGFPVAVKAIGLAHKTERDGVRLGLADGAAVLDAVAALAPLGPRVLVEAMVPDPVAELIVGAVRDPQFGLHLVVGAGGTAVELMADSRVLLLPTDEATVRAALAELKIWPLLGGWRGRPAADVAAAVRAILGVADFAMARADRLLELDVNPLILRAAGLGAVAADAVIRFCKGEPP